MMMPAPTSATRSRIVGMGRNSYAIPFKKEFKNLILFIFFFSFSLHREKGR